MDRRKSTEGEGTVCLHIFELNERIGRVDSSGKTIFDPANSRQTKDSSTDNSVSPTRPAVQGPEKKITLFALRLAVLEKAATGLGTLSFIWATVVLLGGFAITLEKTDFWFITIILLIEGTRILSRSHELEWQHEATATWSIADVGIKSFRAIRASSHLISNILKAIFRPLRRAIRHSRDIAENIHQARHGNWDQEKQPTRMWVSSNVPVLPYGQWVFISRNVSKLLYWLQLVSATTCVVLSLMKLAKHNYGELKKGDTDNRNRKAALNIFYALALAEALLFLIEKVYWEWKVIYCKLLEEVSRECELGHSGMFSIKRFFYDAYSRCVNGSIFDGLKMDMVSFAMELLASNSPDEQLIGARILLKFATSQRFSEDTLEKIGINLPVMERLIEMLNWKDPQEEVIRRSAAEILSKLSRKKQNSLRVAGIPGAMESISSLLHINRNSVSAAADEISEKRNIFDDENYSFWTFNHLGLLILKKLARDHDNCGKIGNKRGLLPKIIDFTHTGERLLKDETVTESQILSVKRSLQVVKMLTSTTGATGKQLRKKISEVVFTISNIRDIMRYGGRYPELQKLGIEILTSLALEEDAAERIGGTGGVLKELFNIFFKEMPEKQNHVRTAAGEALAMLALESKSNCHRIIKLNVIRSLIGALEVPLLCINSARILRNLCTYSGSNCFEQLKGVKAAAPTVLRAIIIEENKLQEVMVGLAAHVFKFMTSEETKVIFKMAGIQEADLASKLAQILKKHRYPSIKIPRIRRFAIELTIWMMKDKKTNIQIFKDLGMEEELESLTETTSELESFNIFSGTVGLSRHSTTIHSLVESALALLAQE